MRIALTVGAYLKMDHTHLQVAKIVVELTSISTTKS